MGSATSKPYAITPFTPQTPTEYDEISDAMPNIDGSVQYNASIRRKRKRAPQGFEQQQIGVEPFYRHRPIEISTVFPPPLSSPDKSTIESLISLLLKNSDVELLGFLHENGSNFAWGGASQDASLMKPPRRYSHLSASRVSLPARTPSVSFPKKHHFTGLNVKVQRDNSHASALHHTQTLSELLRPNKEMRTVWHYLAIVWNYISPKQIRCLFRWTHAQFCAGEGIGEQADSSSTRSASPPPTSPSAIFKWISLLLDTKDVFGYTPMHIILYHYNSTENLATFLQLLHDHGILDSDYFQMSVLLFCSPIGEPDLSRGIVRKKRQRRDVNGVVRRQSQRSSEAGLTNPGIDTVSHHSEELSLIDGDVELSSVGDTSTHPLPPMTTDPHSQSFVQQQHDVQSYTLRWTYKPFGGLRKASRKTFIAKYEEVYAALKEYLHLVDVKKASKKKLQKLAKNASLPTNLRREWAEVLVDILHGYLLVYCEDALYLSASTNDVVGVRNQLETGEEFDRSSKENSQVKKSPAPYNTQHDFLKHAIYEHAHHPKVVVEAAAQAMHLNNVATLQHFLNDASDWSVTRSICAPVLGALNLRRGKSAAVNGANSTPTETPRSKSSQSNAGTGDNQPTSALQQISKEFIDNIDRINSRLGGGRGFERDRPETTSPNLPDSTDLLLNTEHAVKEEITFLSTLFSDSDNPLPHLFLEPVSLIFDKISFPWKDRFQKLNDVHGDRMQIQISSVLDVACMHGFESAVDCALANQMTPTEDHLLLSLASDHQNISMRLIEREGVVPGERLLLLACMINAVEVAALCLRFTSATYTHVYLAIKHRFTELSDMLVERDGLFEESIAACVELGSIKYLERYYVDDRHEEQRMLYDATMDIQRALELRYVAMAEFLFLHEKKLARRSHEHTIVCACVMYDNFEALRKFMEHLLFDAAAYRVARSDAMSRKEEDEKEEGAEGSDEDSFEDPARHLATHNVLFICAQKGRTHLLRFIIEHPMRIEHTEDMFGEDFSVLHVAAQYGHQQLLQYLLEELFMDYYSVEELMGEANVKRFCKEIGDASAEHLTVNAFVAKFLQEVRYDGCTVLELGHGHRVVREYLGKYLERVDGQ